MSSLMSETKTRTIEFGPLIFRVTREVSVINKDLHENRVTVRDILEIGDKDRGIKMIDIPIGINEARKVFDKELSEMDTWEVEVKQDNSYPVTATWNQITKIEQIVSPTYH